MEGMPSGGGPPERTSRGDTSASGSSGAVMPSRKAETVASRGPPGIWVTLRSMIGTVVVDAGTAGGGGRGRSGGGRRLGRGLVVVGRGVGAPRCAPQQGCCQQSQNPTGGQPSCRRGLQPRTHAAVVEPSCDATPRPAPRVHAPVHSRAGKYHKAHAPAGSSTRCRAFVQRSTRSSCAITNAEHGASPELKLTRSWVIDGSSMRYSHSAYSGTRALSWARQFSPPAPTMSAIAAAAVTWSRAIAPTSAR